MAQNQRRLSFGAGPGLWPPSALERAAAGLTLDPATRLSVAEWSHRSPEYAALQQEVLELLRRLLDVPPSHEVLLLPGGASLQFAMVPLNLLRAGRPAEYALTGRWSIKAAEAARALGEVRVVADGESGNFAAIPDPAGWRLDPRASYLHLTTNNTIYGTQLRQLPETGEVPLVADVSSDILTRPLPVERMALLYAGAQKNLGPAGLAVVIIRRDLLEPAREDLPSMLRYADHAAQGSRLNTPPTVLIHMMGEMLRWVEAEGGAREMHRRAEERARIVYEAIDRYPNVYEPHARREDRSRTNVTFRLRAPADPSALLAAAEERGLVGLKGHRSVGGFRASLYAPMPLEGARRLAELLDGFATALD